MEEVREASQVAELKAGSLEPGATMQDYRHLQVWKKAHVLVQQVYRLLRRFPSEEKYGLVSQMQRSAVSICANIAEGCGRGSDKDFRRFLYIAKGSVNELQYYFILCESLELMAPAEAQQLGIQITEVSRMLVSLNSRL